MAHHTGIQYTGELLDWGFDWSDVLPDGVSVSTSNWTISPDVVVTKQTAADNVNAVWVTDLAASTTYTLTNRVTLTDGVRSYDQSIVLYCLDSDGGGVTVSEAATPEGDALVWSDGTRWIFTEL